MSTAGEFSAEAHGTWFMPDEQPQDQTDKPEPEPEEEPQPDDDPPASS